MHAGYILYARAQTSADNELVKIVEMFWVLNAYGILFGCLLFANRNMKRYGTKSECKIAILIKGRYSSSLCLPLDLRISDILADITGDLATNHTHEVRL